MKTKYVAIASALLISAAGFAQKEQLKGAEKALKSSNVGETKRFLDEAQPLMANATDEERGQYYFLSGRLHLQMAKNKVESGKNYMEALKAFDNALASEKKSGKSKNARQIEIEKLSVIAGIKDNAYADYRNKDFKGAAEKYNALYENDKTQLEYLYNASNASLLGKDYDASLRYLQQLQDANYSGAATYYKAYNILTKQTDYFEDAKSRDAAVKSGTHNNPEEEAIKSKAGEIARNIAFILIEQGKVDEAKLAITKAKAANPDDISIILSEANLYLKTNDLATYGSLIKEVLEKQPDNVELIFNLGVISYTNKDFANAEKYYRRVIEINPNYANAYFNLAALKIDEASAMLDTMNKLGTTAAENKKYDAMKKQRDALLNEIVTLLEKTVSLDKNNLDAKASLVSVYNALEMYPKAKALKAELEAQEGK